MRQLSEQPNPSPCLPKRSGYSGPLKCIRSNRIFEGGGAALFHPEKWRPEVSSCRLMTGKSSMFIPCIYLTTLTHFDWTSGVRIASYSRRLKCIRSNRIFEGGGAALFHPEKWRPEVSSCRLMTGKSSMFREQHYSILKSDALRWVLVVWWRAKAQCLSHVSISRHWPTLIGRLGYGLPPTAVDWTALDQIEFLRDGEQHYSIVQSDALRWVLVVWWRAKAQCLSHVSISRLWPTLIGRLGSGLPPTAVDWTALDQIEFLR